MMTSPGTEPTTRSTSSSPMVKIGLVVAVVVLLVIGFFAFGGRSTLEEAGVLPASNPETGECIAAESEHPVVDCDSPDAEYRVVDVLDIPEEGPSRATCAAVDSATGMILTTNNSGKLLCVSELSVGGAEQTAAPGPAAAEPAQGQSDLSFAVGDCVGQVDGQQQKVECGTPGSRPVLAEVGAVSECQTIEGATGSLRTVGIGVPSGTFCVGVESP